MYLGSLQGASYRIYRSLPTGRMSCHDWSGPIIRHTCMSVVARTLKCRLDTSWASWWGCAQIPSKLCVRLLVDYFASSWLKWWYHALFVNGSCHSVFHVDPCLSSWIWRARQWPTAGYGPGIADHGGCFSKNLVRVVNVSPAWMHWSILKQHQT